MRTETPALRRLSLLVAVGCVLGDGAPFLLRWAHMPLHPAVWAAGALILLADLALALPARRTAGWVAIAHAAVRVGVAVLLLAATGEVDTGIGNSTGLAVAAYRAGAWLRGSGSFVTLAALGLGLFGTQVIQGYAATSENVLLTFTNSVLPWLLGRHTTGLAGRVDEVRRQAEEQQRAAAAAVEAERTAIARDLHDTISHHVSAVGMHASAARLALSVPEPAADRVTGSLQQVEVSSRAALADLRRMLDLLHGQNGDGVRQPGLGALDELIEGSGLTVRLTVSGLDPARLPDSLNLAVYRIIQELLTNASRHGDGGIDLSVTQTAASLRVTGVNRLAGHAGFAGGTGRGLDGVRHRAGMFGGTVQAGPAGDAWRVDLTIPI